MSTRENIRLIARTPLKPQFDFIKFLDPIKDDR